MAKGNGMTPDCMQAARDEYRSDMTAIRDLASDLSRNATKAFTVAAIGIARGPWPPFVKGPMLAAEAAIFSGAMLAIQNAAADQIRIEQEDLKNDLEACRQACMNPSA